MYSERLLQLFRSAAHAGDLPEATHYGEAGTPGQGPYIRLWLLVEAGKVLMARFKTYGCPAAIACAEAGCAWSEGRRWAELSTVTPAQIAAQAGGVPEGKEHCPDLVARAFESVRPSI